ncbi:MAG: SixA phosphatase family protein [Planctomycetota bacterium]|jgi:broad specificity phosphatase PhoE
MNHTKFEKRTARYVLITFLTIVIIVVVWFCYLCWFYEDTTVLLVRHADRINNVDDLTSDGEARAAKLVHVAGKAGITAIYHSDTTRTRKTAAELANYLGLTPAAANTQQLIDLIRSNHRGQKVFVVGHSDTVPDIIEGLGGGTMPDIPHSEYDNLFVVTLCQCRWGSTTVVNLQYGASTSP